MREEMIDAKRSDEEVADTLIAISVVAKVLAKQIMEEKETKDEKELQPDGKDD